MTYKTKHEKLMESKRFNHELPMKQTMCKQCGGMISLHVNGLLVNPLNWIKYGFACDIGCIC